MNSSSVCWKTSGGESIMLPLTGPAMGNKYLLYASPNHIQRLLSLHWMSRLFLSSVSFSARGDQNMFLFPVPFFPFTCLLLNWLIGVFANLYCNVQQSPSRFGTQLVFPLKQTAKEGSNAQTNTLTRTIRHGQPEISIWDLSCQT